MKSDVCKIGKSNKNLEAILKESERVAQYNGLTHKQTLQLRLLCEEIDGMLPNIINDYEGDIWIEFEDGVCKINVSIRISEFNTCDKEELINIATNKKNAAAVGITGKIRDAVENFLLNEDVKKSFAVSAEMAGIASSYGLSMDCSRLWSLNQYRTTVEKEEHSESWDELEKSVIASVADDVIVGVKGKCAEIIIIKKFA